MIATSNLYFILILPFKIKKQIWIHLTHWIKKKQQNNNIFYMCIFVLLFFVKFLLILLECNTIYFIFGLSK